MFKKILVPLDLTPFAENALGQAAALARRSSATIDLVVVRPGLSFDRHDNAPWDTRAARRDEEYVEAIAAELRSGAQVRVSTAARNGIPIDTICRRARTVDADLIVMTSHGRTGVSRSVLGSVAVGVVRHSSTPVLVLREPTTRAVRLAAHPLPQRIAVALDGSALSLSILPSVVALARAAGASVTLLRVVADTAACFELERIAQQIAQHHGLEVDARVLVAADVATAIVDCARTQGADVIAMSTRGRGVSRLMAGGNANQVLARTTLPMLIYRPLVSGEAQLLSEETEITAEATSVLM